MKKLFFSFFCLWGHLHCEVDEQTGEFTGLLANEVSLEEEPFYCRGIVLLGPEEPLYSETDLQAFEEEGVQLKSLQFTGDQRKLLASLQNQFIGQSLDEESLYALQGTVLSFYERHHHPLVRVTIPPQDISSGILQVRVVESLLSQVEVQGGKYTSSQLLKNYLGLKPDETIDVQKLKKNLQFMNRNPFRRVDAIYSAGEVRNTTDVTLLVEDARPINVFVGSDNTGIETTERARLYSGIHLSKLFGFDHFFAYQYTCAYDLKRFQAHTAQLALFLPFRNVWNFYGGYSKVKADLPFPSNKTKGHSMQASTRYTVPLNPSLRFNHEVTGGFDFKNTNNTVEYAESNPTIGKTVNISEFMLGYAGNFIYPSPHLALDFDVEFLFSPGPLLPHESNADYETLRPAAKNHWVYAKGMVKYLQRFSYATIFCWLRGQLSSQNLLPSEQLGIGGFDTVRGYDQYQLTTDSGFIANLELHTRAISLWHKEQKDALVFLAFVDYGYGRNHTALPGEPKSNHLLGVGPGMRYTINPWLTARLDLGFKLEKQPTFTAGNAVWHFGFQATL